MRLKKSLGQHLLTDGRVLARIVEAACITPGDVVLEIGPGTGRLTDHLLAAGALVVAVEKDDQFAPALQARALADTALPLHVVHADALYTDFPALLAPHLAPGAQARVAANLPYNVGTPILIRLLEHVELFSVILVLVQDEVAQRLAAEPGNPARGSLSVFCQMRAEVTARFQVPPAAFTPPPRVMSRVVQLRPYDRPPLEISDPALGERLVRAGFEHRRKTCYNSVRFSLKSGAFAGLVPAEEHIAFIDALFRNAAVSPSARPHGVTNAQWAALANAAARLLSET